MLFIQPKLGWTNLWGVYQKDFQLCFRGGVRRGRVWYQRGYPVKFIIGMDFIRGFREDVSLKYIVHICNVGCTMVTPAKTKYFISKSCRTLQTLPKVCKMWKKRKLSLYFSPSYFLVLWDCNFQHSTNFPIYTLV